MRATERNMFNINRREPCDVCSSFVHRWMLKEEDQSIESRIQLNVQIDDEENGRLCLVVNLLERIFSIECLTSDADVVLGFVSIE